MCDAAVEGSDCADFWISERSDNFVQIVRQDANVAVGEDNDFVACAREIDMAIDRYRQHLEVFGTDIWVDVSEPEIVTGDDLPVRMGV